MTDNTSDLDARLARLAARKAAAATPAAATPTTESPTGATVTPISTNAGPRTDRKRRKHPAAAGRILSVGLSSSAFLSMVATFAQTPYTTAKAGAANTVPTTAPAHTRIVVKEIHHAVYVDQFGRPIVAPSAPTGATAVPTANRPAAGAAPGSSGGSGPGGASSGGGSSWPPANRTPTNTPTPGTVRSTPGPAPAPPSGGGPTPTTTHVSAPPTTAAPTPTTQPTVVTTPPPPPPPPPCTATKCP